MTNAMVGFPRQSKTSQKPSSAASLFPRSAVARINETKDYGTAKAFVLDLDQGAVRAPWLFK
jgi:hypothetical protein